MRSFRSIISPNVGNAAPGADWLHTNAIAYNPQRDEIALSVLGNNEIWIIDHSTTTEEARGSTGGNSGKGGDILYRWGNPIAHRAGFSESSAFIRAFKGWTGVTPYTYRKGL